MPEPRIKSLNMLIMIFLSIGVLLSAQGTEKNSHNVLNGNSLGIYCDNDNASNFDFAINKIDLLRMAEKDKKKKFWEKYRQVNKPVLFEMVFKCPDGSKYRLPSSLMECKRQIDLWLEPEDDIETYPELLYAVCPAEENATWDGQKEIMNGIYSYITAKYKIPVYQFLSEPLPPDVSIKADGWIFDAYSLHGEKYYRHLLKFILYGQPVIPVIWASEPGLAGYYKVGGVAEIIKNAENEFSYYKELDIPAVLFAVDKHYGSTSVWLSSKQEDISELRNYFYKKWQEMKVENQCGVSAHSCPIVEFKGDKQNKYVYSRSFSDFRFVDECLITDPANLRVTEKGLLLKRGTKCVLSWHFKSALSKVDEIMVKVNFSSCLAPSLNMLEISRDGTAWQKAVVDGIYDHSVLVQKVQNTNELYVRLTMTKGVNDSPCNLLTFLEVSAKVSP